MRTLAQRRRAVARRHPGLYGLMQLVAFLEEEFDIEIDDTEVTAENFKTIADIERLVGARLTPA